MGQIYQTKLPVNLKCLLSKSKESKYFSFFKKYIQVGSRLDNVKLDSLQIHYLGLRIGV